ncbi:MAG: pyruvate kinase [Pirellulaceae bacterium]|jgi:pyruvate kinase|nr:pyruvate kinase [Pirellulaceae bacterium]
MSTSGLQVDGARSKIVATVGPACDTVEMLVELIRHGVDVFRINAAHGTQADYAMWLEKIEQARQITDIPVGTLLDLSGPKIRLGRLAQDPLEVEAGQELTIVRGEQSTEPMQLCSNYGKLIDEIKVNDSIMLADGTISLKVKSKTKDVATCKVLTAGTIRSRQGINLPGVTLSVSAMRPEDVQNAIWGAKNEIDFISLSFVRSPQDVATLKDLLQTMDSKALVIAKIEKREALERLEDIVEAADGVMVARGDLGVEIDVAETPVAQKRIIQVCREKLKPVIVATQMLESMHTNRRPTRAEASDVANAILDGADACMLSGETAIGKFPAEAVATMDRIMVFTEQLLRDQPAPGRMKKFDRVHPITSAVTFNAANIAEAINAKLVVVASRTGGTAWIKSKQRNYIATLGVSDNEATLRRMSLFWGIVPHRISNIDNPQKLLEEVITWGRVQNILTIGDRVVFVTGTGVIDNTHNLLVVHEVGAS